MVTRQPVGNDNGWEGQHVGKPFRGQLRGHCHCRRCRAEQQLSRTVSPANARLTVISTRVSPMDQPKQTTQTKSKPGSYRVFVSLSSHDLDEWKAIEERLTKEHIAVWCYADSIVPSEEFAAVVAQHIEESDIFLLLLSKHSNQSAEVRKEVRLAAHSQRRCIRFLTL